MRILGIFGVCFVALSGALAGAETFAFQQNDRVVFLGNTFFEREYRYGHIETLLTARFAGKGLTFRNLAWSGDTVWGASRASFDTAKEGYERMLRAVKEAAPTVIFFSFGQVESFETENSFSAFAAQLDVLLDDLEGTGARMVLLSPTFLEKLPPPLPDPAGQNVRMLRYIEHLRGTAQKRGHFFVDMAALVQYDPQHPLTDNTLHFTDEGYKAVAAKLLEGLGHAPLAGGDADPAGLAFRVAALRGLVIEKNRLFFNKWRPQNETYIYGFRKYEQGQHQAETPMYDPLVAALEQQIAETATAQTPEQE